MKIHGTTKGGALSKKDFGVAFGAPSAPSVLYPDSMGTSANLSNQGSTLNTSGQLLGTGCWEFTNPDEATDEYIDADAIKAITTTVGSINQWCYVASGLAINDFYTLCWGDASVNEFLGISREGGGGSDQRARVHCRKSGVDQWKSETGDHDWTADAWHMITLVQDGTAVKWYFDATEITTFLVDADKSAWLADLTGIDNCRIGCKSIANQGNLSFYNGLMDSVCFWNTAISSDIVDELWADGAGKAIPSISTTDGIRAFYNCDSIDMENDAMPIS